MTVTAVLYGTLVPASWAVARLPCFATAGIENTGAVPIEDRAAPSLIADTERVDAPQAAAMGNADVAHDDVATAAEPVTVTAADTTAVPEEPKSIVDAAPPDLSQIPPHETPPVQLATASTPDPGPDEVKAAAGPAGLLGQCGIADSCIDRYLWALYQRTPKEDTIKVQERRQVTVKKKRKMVTVTKTFTRLVDEDFAWKDPKAAEKAGMPMMDYVIGGMDHQRVPRRLPSIDRKRPEGGDGQVIPRRELPWRLWPRVCRRCGERQRRDPGGAMDFH
jgi:hypothetical protein